MRKKLVVSSRFYNSSAVEHEQAIRVANRGKAVSDDERGPVACNARQCSLDGHLAFDVERRGSFVENQNLRIRQNRAGYRDALSLTAR